MLPIDLNQSEEPARIRVALVPYPGAQQAAVLGLCDLFALANRHARAAGGDAAMQFVVTQHAPRNSGAEAPHILILPPCLGDLPDAEQIAPFLPWLRDHHAGGATLCSICAGAFLLAETGLLAGRRATTHWIFGQPFREAFPEVVLDMDQLIVDEGDIITAGGLMAWLDLGLKLVERYQGTEVMIETAQMLLVDPPGREQRYYSGFAPCLTHGDASILKVQTWLRETGATEASLNMLAAIAGLEERTFLRRFQRATGMTSTVYCQQLRVARARGLLQSGSLPVDRIAWEVGYSDPGAFRKVFQRITGLTPGEYRRRFRPATGARIPA